MPTKPSLLICGLLGCFALLSLVSCASPQKRMAREVPALRSRWQADVAHQSNLPERRLTWTEAVALLRENNLKLRSARVDITNSQEIARQVYRDLIPTINLNTGVSKSLQNLPATSVDDVTFNINSIFNVPGVVNFNGRLFSGKLSVMRARAACQLTEREQTIELYKLFLEARENDEQAAELKSERSVAEAVRQADGVSGEVLLKDIENQERDLAKTDESFQTRVGDLLADRSFRWVLRADGLPEFDYAAHPLPLDDTNRVAQLQTKMEALELVGDWAVIHGIRLQYWPELSFFVTGPSLYQFNGGQSSFASAANVVGTANFFWSLDTRGYVRQQLRTTKRAQDLEKVQLHQDSLALIDRMIAARRTAETLHEEAARLDQLLAFLEKVPPDLDVNSILQRAETNRSLHFQRARVRRDLAELNTVFWFVDEAQWPDKSGSVYLTQR